VKLYIVYLGGTPTTGRMGEDHEVVAVAAKDPAAARETAKLKWRGAGSPHVDAVQELDIVDSHQVCLIHVIGTREDSLVDPTWEP
jgi:hypothetical protein